LDLDCERLVSQVRVSGEGIVLPANDEDLDELMGFVAAEDTTRRTAGARSVWMSRSRRSATRWSLWTRDLLP
jgi:hypothetical protein